MSEAIASMHKVAQGMVAPYMTETIQARSSDGGVEKVLPPMQNHHKKDKPTFSPTHEVVVRSPASPVQPP